VRLPVVRVGGPREILIIGVERNGLPVRLTAVERIVLRQHVVAHSTISCSSGRYIVDRIRGFRGGSLLKLKLILVPRAALRKLVP
jgi:hypothetical protein